MQIFYYVPKIIAIIAYFYLFVSSDFASTPESGLTGPLNMACVAASPVFMDSREMGIFRYYCWFLFLNKVIMRADEALDGPVAGDKLEDQEGEQRQGKQ